MVECTNFTLFKKQIYFKELIKLQCIYNKEEHNEESPGEVFEERSTNSSRAMEMDRTTIEDSFRRDMFILAYLECNFCLALKIFPSWVHQHLLRSSNVLYILFSYGISFIKWVQIIIHKYDMDVSIKAFLSLEGYFYMGHQYSVSM